MPETLTLPNTPKIHLARFLANGKDSTAVAPIEVEAPTSVMISHDVDKQAFAPKTALDTWQLDAPQQVTNIDIPARFAAKQPVVFAGPENGGGLIHIHVGEHATVELQERWNSTGEHLGIWVVLDIEDGASVSWLTYDAFQAKNVVVARTANLANAAKLNWTVAGFSHNSGVTLLTTNLNGDGAEATVNVGVLASGMQNIGYVTAITNYARKTIGHINQRGVITNKAHMIFNGIGHIVKGARGSDAQQENRVLMLSQHARGDANPILYIDENDVTAGHAASVSRVDERQMYYLMSRGVPETVAKRLVIRGFLEAGLKEITDKQLKKELFATIDETLVNTDA